MSLTVVSVALSQMFCTWAKIKTSCSFFSMQCAFVWWWHQRNKFRLIKTGASCLWQAFSQNQFSWLWNHEPAVFGWLFPRISSADCEITSQLNSQLRDQKTVSTFKYHSKSRGLRLSHGWPSFCALGMSEKRASCTAQSEKTQNSQTPLPKGAAA